MNMVLCAAGPDNVAVQELDSYRTRMIELGEFTVSFATMSKGFGGSDLFKGLPNDMCPCSHWGVLNSGRWHVRFADGRECTVEGGQAYYIPPGHIFEALEDSDVVDFTPTAELGPLMARMARNLGALR